MFLSVVLSATFASAQPNEVVRDQITLRGTVEAVDHATRTARIRGDRGNVVTIDISKSVGAFDQVQTGDVVTVAYYDKVAVSPHPADKPAVDRTDPPVTTPSSGGLPGATVASSRVTTVTITGWDPATRVVSFTGPTGINYSRGLLDSTDASIMSGLKAGDRVDVTRTEAVQFAVEQRTTVEASPVDTLRDRLTVSVLWGWDNQFSGNMIKETTGQTTTGVPINMNETTFDEVYGRMGGFKIGVGYRTSPRIETAVNFVYSNSASDSVTVGGITSANLPLNVKFGDYSYWGIEGGQRFFFARVRFTPFVGYLVGLNRFGDIEGTIENLPSNVTLPGYTAQEGKFFEKSWALSLGPTGGFLIGLGPVEFMFEAQLRYMGGLSDVDWLVEEGLRDINSESSRWSYPLQIGARIRF